MQHRPPSRRRSTNRCTRRALLAAGVAAALVATIAPAAADPTRQERARTATRFLAGNQEQDGSIAQFSPFGDTADAVAALVLARRGAPQIERAMEYLEANLSEARTIGLVAKVVMAVVAAGGDPRDFGGRDLVDEIRQSQQADGQLGGESDADVAYHALAMLALIAAGEQPNLENGTWLLQARCDDGGWQFDEPSSAGDDEHCRESDADYVGSDTNTTSLVVQAMSRSPGPDATGDSLEYLRSAIDPVKKGFIYDPTQRCTEETVGTGCYLTDSNSTALGIQALIALEQPLPARRIRALHRLQYPLCGPNGGGVAFSWDYDPETKRFSRQPPSVGSTIAAIPALLYHTFPLPHREVTKPPPRRTPCR